MMHAADTLREGEFLADYERVETLCKNADAINELVTWGASGVTIVFHLEIFKNKHPTTPLQVENIIDLGYLGVKDDLPTVKYVLPFRKKRKSELR
jgi:hypothetical protein